MPLLARSVSYVLRVTLLGLFIRAVVAIYLNYWNFQSISSIKDTLQPFLYGWHFDLAMAGFAWFLLFGSQQIFNWSKGSLRFLNWVLMLIYVVFATTDALYAKESGRHISYEVYNLFTIEATLPALLARFWLPGLFGLCAASFASWWTRPSHRESRGFFSRIFSFLFITALSLVFVRGFEGIPQDPSWAYRAGGESTGAILALNGAYGITWASFAGKKSSKENIVVPASVPSADIFKEWRAKRGIQKAVGNFDGNIVMVFLEGWSGVTINQKQNNIEILPFFNSLRKESMHPELMLAGGHRTTEGLFASLCSLPNPPGKSIMFTEIENKNFTCLPQLLTKKGYSSAFFQGSDQFTSGVGLLVLKTGFLESYGKREIPNWEKLNLNAWGVYDTDLYKFMLTKMDTMTEPMLIGVNTNTTHDTVLPPGITTDLGINNLHYADSELRVFYDNLKKRKWKKDWLLVLVADHTSYSPNGIFENYAIPFLMKYHSVGGSKKNPLFKDEEIKGAFHQNDVAATLADLTGVAATEFLGRSMLRPQDFSDGASIFHLGESAWFQGPWSIVFNIRKYPEYKCFDWRKDMSFKKPLTCPANGEKMYLEGLSYIKESQELLFK